MSKVSNNSKTKAWGPPHFPESGRLPTNTSMVAANHRKQTYEEDLFCRVTDSRGQKRYFECCHSLHISLFSTMPMITRSMMPRTVDLLMSPGMFHASNGLRDQSNQQGNG
ncbi:hypothetical protein [Pseudomonas agarici]|uniref:hypothetical protein n=1 Tax=Pseudomonas agarici TaxID=46677 RepID=UPI0009E9B08B|nr:hypothetical protein [Pseudomonas agarici]